MLNLDSAKLLARRRRVKDAAVEKNVSGITVISQKLDRMFTVAAVVYGHF
jgi:hypothetical protein